MQIYAVVYAATGQFLIGEKLLFGYYFSSDGGRIVPKGQRLNGGGLVALPGGRQEADETVRAGCLREFHEETGARLDTYSRFDEQSFDDNGKPAYAAGYFRIEATELTKLRDQINDPNLLQAKAAAREIQSKKITRYSQIHELHQHAPADDELDRVRVMDVTDSADWEEIQSWKDNKKLDWFYHILLHLKTSILSSSGAGTRSTGRPRPSSLRLSPVPTQDEHRVALRTAYQYFDEVGLGNDPYDPNIADSNGLVTFINAASNPPPPELVEEQKEISYVLEGLTGIVTAAVLQVSGEDDKEKHRPSLWAEPIQYGLAPFMSGFSTETVTYNRTVRGVEVATQFLNILLDAVVDEGGALNGFRKFLADQGETIRIQGQDTQEGYQFACVGMVHEIFQVHGDQWIYVPKIRAYFTSFTRRTFKISSGCASVNMFDFDFRLETFTAPFKIQMWRDRQWFRDEVDSFIQEYTKANIEKSEGYFNGIFKSKPA